QVARRLLIVTLGFCAFLRIVLCLSKSTANQACGSHASGRQFPGVALLWNLTKVDKDATRRSKGHLFGRSANSPEDSTLSGDHIDSSRHCVDHRNALLAQELQQRLVWVETIENSQVGLVWVAMFVLFLIRWNIQLARDRHNAVSIDESGR